MNVNVGPAQTLAKHDAGLAPNGLGAFPDGLFGWRWKDPVQDWPVFYASNGGNVAMLDMGPPANKRLSSRAIGLPPQCGYCAGGPIITNPIDGSWLMVAHTEQYPANKQGFYGTLSLIRSPDHGVTWFWLGIIVEPCVRFSDTMPVASEIAGGSLVFNGENLCIYFRDTDNNYHGCAGMAFANAQEVFKAAANMQVSNWTKYPDQPAIGGGMAQQLPGLISETDWNTVLYLADKKLYLMALCPWGTKRIQLATSPDGISWTVLPINPVTEPGYQFYPTLIPTNYDERFALGNPWLYYMVVKDLTTVWPGMEVHRRRLVL